MEQERPITSTVVQIITLCIIPFGLLANIFCVIVLTRKNMKSSFNTILLGLTCSDILLLIKASITGINNLHVFLHHTSAVTVQSLFIFAWICDAGTKYFTAAVSFERYIAICHPLKARSLLTHRRSQIFAFCAAAFVFCLAMTNYYFAFHSDLLTYHNREIIKAVVLNFGPLLVILVFNLLIYWELSHSEIRKKLSLPSNKNSAVNRMLLSVVLVFGFCYSFESIRRVMGYFVTIDIYNNTGHLILHVLADFFYVFNSAVNFIIYYLMGEKFRSEFLLVFGGFVPFCISKIFQKSKQCESQNQTQSSSLSNNDKVSVSNDKVIKVDHKKNVIIKPEILEIQVETDQIEKAAPSPVSGYGSDPEEDLATRSKKVYTNGEFRA